MTPSATNLHVQSSERVAVGQLPLLRTEIPGMPRDCDEHGFMFVISGGAKPVILESNGSSDRIGPNAEEIIDLYEQGHRMLFTDRATLSAVLRVLNRTGNYKNKKAAQVIAYLAKLPMAYHAVVLTDALALKYWAPVGCDDLAGWVAAFGMTSMSDVGAIRSLIERAGEGTSPVFPCAFGYRLGRGLFRSLRAGKRSSIDAYRKINSHMEMWGAVQRTDRHLRSSFLRTGDVVKVTPFKCLGGIIEATATTPFKLRPGSSVFVFDDSAGYEVSLLDLGFDSGTQSLTARFAPSTFGSKRTKSNGYDMLADPARRGSEFWVTSAPFQANRRTNPGDVRQGTVGDGAPTRELPLYVSLAAAAS
jgi:hypothetical protein